MMAPFKDQVVHRLIKYEGECRRENGSDNTVATRIVLTPPKNEASDVLSSEKDE